MYRRFYQSFAIHRSPVIVTLVFFTEKWYFDRSTPLRFGPAIFCPTRGKLFTSYSPLQTIDFPFPAANIFGLPPSRRRRESLLALAQGGDDFGAATLRRPSGERRRPYRLRTSQPNDGTD